MMDRAYSRWQAARTCSAGAVSTWSFVEEVGWVPGLLANAFGTLERRGLRWIGRVGALALLGEEPGEVMVWVEDGGRVGPAF